MHNLVENGVRHNTARQVRADERPSAQVAGAQETATATTRTPDGAATTRGSDGAATTRGSGGAAVTPGPDGGAAARGARWVRVLSRTVGGRVELVVSNTGPEIPPYEVESLFKPFYRLGAERLVGGKGAGLGLSIVRSVAEAHGGTVDAVPRAGGGLEITVVLPVDPG
nr:sensor histidine kinase [Kribbella aluminosa]